MSSNDEWEKLLRRKVGPNTRAILEGMYLLAQQIENSEIETNNRLDSMKDELEKIRMFSTTT